MEGVYQILGRSKLQSVPYALYAEKAGTVDNVDDADADPGNELQDLSNSISGTDVTLNITDGIGTTFSIDDGDSDNTNELQVLSISNDTIYLSNGGSVKLHESSGVDNDNDPENEIQIISISNDTIYLSDGGNIKLPPETDPTFDTSAAKTITATATANWNTAYSWGNHANEGYLTSETDPTFDTSVAKTITATATANWNTAFSWGNHADEGYLTEEQDSSITNELQDLSSSKTGNEVTVRISDGDSTTFSINDDDADPQNEWQTIRREGNRIIISGNEDYAELPEYTVDTNIQELRWDPQDRILGITGTDTTVDLTNLIDSITSAGWDKDTSDDFSGNYNELSNLPAWSDTIDAHVPDLSGYVETANTSGWDKNVLDDFSGDYNDLSDAPDLSDSVNWNTAYNWGNHADEGYLTEYSETDPIFNAHLASDITATDTSNWNEAHSWGDHSAEGYLTAYNETDPVFDAHLTSDITATDTTNWNEAYGWGDHADEGYLTSYNETDPIFTSHLSYGIMASDTANWNDAFNWGDHSSAGYLTSEVDGSINNELQTINFSNDTLYLSNGGNVYLGDYAETTGDTVDLDDQILKISKILPGGTVDSFDFDSGLIAYYPFNKNANDESGNANHGVVYGAALTTDRFGNDSSAYIFDGSNDYIEIPNTSGWNFVGQDFTICVWAMCNSTTLAQGIIAKHTNWYPNGYVIVIDNGYYAGSPSLEYYPHSDIEANDSKWRFITGTFSGSTFNLYVDGKLKGTANFGTLIANSENLRFGIFGSQDYFSGKIDDIRFYDRAFDLSEIYAAYYEGISTQQLAFYDEINGEVTLSDLKDDFSNGGEAGGEPRYLGNTDNYGLGFLTNNNTRLFIDKTGNLGVGTKTPGAKLNLIMDGLDNVCAFSIGEGQWYSERYGLYGYFAGAGNENKVVLKTGGNSNVMTWLHDGKIGIGTMEPKNILDIEGGIVIGTSYSGTNTAPTNGLLVEGNVGIGNNNPSYKLDLAGHMRIQGPDGFDAWDEKAILYLGDNASYIDHTYGYRVVHRGYNGFDFLTDAADTVVTIISNGNVGIGTTSPSGLLGLSDENTYLDVDGSNNLTFTDAVTGTKTLAELAADETGYWNSATGGISYSSGNVAIGGNPVETVHNNLNIYDPDTYHLGLLYLDGHNGGLINATSRRSNDTFTFGTGWDDALSNSTFIVNHSVNGGLFVITDDGKVGIGENILNNKLEVKGNMVIGASYTGTNTAPTNGLLVEGNVGIGVTSPEKKLHVNGDIMVNALEKFIAKFDNSGNEFRGNFGFDGIQFGNNDWNYIIAGNTYGGQLKFVVNNTTDLVDYNRYSYHNGIEAMGITVSGGIVIGPSYMGNNPGTGNMIITGNIGIGTTSPSGKLHVQGGTTGSADSAFVVTSDARVGIGITSPAATLDVNGTIGVNASPTNQTASGIITTATVDVNSTGIGALLYLASDGNYEEADADAASTMPGIALALETGTGSKKILHQGYVRNDSWSLTVGQMVYASTTSGAITQTQPSDSGDHVQIIGMATATNTIFFNPNYMLIEIK
ncbi:MAG: LamG domain-containing protein [Calditrichaceae bacterium]|nr:LamG domain-containing protein [Calditrichaceae bacterium]